MLTANQEPLVYKAGPFGIISLPLLGSVSIIVFTKIDRIYIIWLISHL